MTLDDDIDQLYRGPLEAFTDARNALAKTAKRAEVKTLQKPSVPAWAVNQLYWHHRPVVERLEAAAEAVREQHRRALAGGKADIAAADRAHREAVREAVGVAKEVLTAGRQALTPATLEAIRDTLSALPSPEAQGRLVRPLAPRGLDALAGLVLAARPGPVAAPAASSAKARDTGQPARAATARDDAARARTALAAQKAAEKDAKARAARRAKAEAVLAEARARLTEADDAVAQAEQDLATRQAERIAAREAVKRAQREVEELSFGR